MEDPEQLLPLAFNCTLVENADHTKGIHIIN